LKGTCACTITASPALILARVFGNSPDFWLNVKRRSDLWNALHSPRERQRIKRARAKLKTGRDQEAGPRSYARHV
jgi:plasmid maintenance system antidote protein VapI